MSQQMIEVEGLDKCKADLPDWNWGVTVDSTGTELVKQLMIDGAAIVIDELAQGTLDSDKHPTLLLGANPLIAIWPFNGDWPELRINLRPVLEYYADDEIGEDGPAMLAFAVFLREMAERFEKTAESIRQQQPG